MRQIDKQKEGETPFSTGPYPVTYALILRFTNIFCRKPVLDSGL